ncbi:four helix bundle protein [Chryseobacterium sp. PTM-20240506]|uniref:four helix bundle protein n=1 Tax=unclassified Chryseobacterium TaxID=2593645 RepID=UPI002358E718|nr:MULTISPECIES: four helix bundle protein [unclassified Chryseobacterium]MDC8103363.1 four helix bundle protein [Chryseobacterium sp. B21-037]MDQ1802917.1 four helix bundle protein [Chryseobacterium sp. CKR4-1]WBV56916.1 four helix bundle protein [Chryseobacterium daecheongense]
MHNFEKLLFWQKSIQLAKEVYLVCVDLPKDEKFGLISQIKRSVVSIPSNIAEGAGRNNDREFYHFLGIANASSFELQTQLILTRELELLSVEKVDSLISQLNEIQRMIYTFKSNLKK